MANLKSPDNNSLPLYEKIEIKRTTHKVLDIIIFILLLSLLSYRLKQLHFNHSSSWLWQLQTLAFLCESWFTFTWFLLINIKWTPIQVVTYPDRLLKRDLDLELPPVDMFVTTADPILEPPIITVNTVLSLLALDYPADKLACYVSDDGCSPLTFYSLSEALKFAKIWVPFCKKYGVQVRAPFRYFLNGSETSPPLGSREFQNEWKRIKNEYEKLKTRIEKGDEMIVVAASREFAEDFAVFTRVQSKDHHPAIIKILWENKEGLSDGLPHLIYISREKRSKHPHNYKAGAMNVLTRVSGLMTNGDYMLNVDCDMFINDPKVVLRAMCVLLDPKSDKEVGFVQFPQRFYNGLKDDPYGNQLLVLYEFIARGIDGIQGCLYGGTGCFHRRKVIYGHSPTPHDSISIHLGKGNESNDEFLKTFGYSKTFVDSVTRAFKRSNADYQPNSLSTYIESANHVAGSTYEISTAWGSKVGWIYGSTTEDVHTGLVIHRKGWRSISVTPNQPAFLGCTPSGGPVSLTQQKRWATGLLEVLMGKNSPILSTLFGKLQIRQCVVYLWILTWGLRAIPELSYSGLLAYSLITNSHFFPTANEPIFCVVPISLFVVYNFQQLLQYYETRQSLRAWWNNQRMGRINTMCAWIFGVVSVIFKLLGTAEAVFEVTKKESSSSDNDDKESDPTDAGRFTFDESPFFVVGTTVVLIQLAALFIWLLRLRPNGGGNGGQSKSGAAEIIGSIWLVLCFWPFFKGMFGKGKYGIPLSTIYKSTALAILFVSLSLLNSIVVY